MSTRILQAYGERVAMLESELRSLLDAFVRHRTTTHEVAPKHCKTCRESDAAIERARLGLDWRR